MSLTQKIVSIGALFLFLISPSFALAANLVPNGDFETAGPASWTNDSWGTLSATFTYPVAGDASVSGAKVAITSYSSGDAKWYMSEIPVTVGTIYQVSDNYSSNVATEVDAEFLMSDGSYSYVVIATPASTAGAWGSFAGQVTAPTGAVSMAILHLLDKVGTLTLDNVSVTSGTTPPPPPPPSKPIINSFVATPTTIQKGQSSTLTWSQTGATTLLIDQNVGVVTGTSKSVSPIATTTYTLSAGNSAGTTTALVTVNVSIPQTPPPPPPAPTCSLVANPTSILVGSSTTLTFSSTNSTSANINQNIGVVATSGTKIVSPAVTTLYTGTFAGAGGTTTCSANVTVTQPAPPPPPPPTNLVNNGNLEAGSTNAPTGWTHDYWGSLTANFTYPVAGHNGGKAAQLQITKFSSGAANWIFNHVTDSSHTVYQFNEDYLATAPTEIDIEFLMSNGTYDYEWLDTLPASASWQTISTQVTVPTGAVSFTVLHILAQIGTLTIDNASLSPVNAPFAQGMVTFSFDDGLLSQSQNAAPMLKTAGFPASFYIITGEPTSGDSGYMTWAQIKAIATQGFEIGGHTRTHPFLTQLTTTQQQSEINGSFTDLVAQGITPKTFVYPFGDVNANVEQMVKNAGYIGARGSYFGLETPVVDHENLYDIRLDSTSNLATIKQYIDQAKADKRWIVFEIHDVLNSSTDSYTITPAFFQSVVSYVKQSGVGVVTMQQGIVQLNP